jgi:hypothetical protein
MARPLRIEYGGAFYHVTARGNGRKRVFFAKADYGAFEKVYFSGWGREAVVEAVCRHFRFSQEELFQDRSLARKVAIYLMRQHTGMTNG